MISTCGLRFAAVPARPVVAAAPPAPDKVTRSVVAELVGSEDAGPVRALISQGSPEGRQDRLELLDLSAHMARSFSRFSGLEHALDIYRQLLPCGLDAETRQALRSLANDLGTWESTGGWGSRKSTGGGCVWSGSPSGTGVRSSKLTSQPISLAGLRGSMLRFGEAHNFLSNKSSCTLEVREPGKSWAPVMEYRGSKPQGEQFVDLSAFDGRTVVLRFRSEIHPRAEQRTPDKGGRVQLSAFTIDGWDTETGEASGIPMEAYMRYRSLQELVGLATDAEEGTTWLKGLAFLSKVPPGERFAALRFARERRASGSLAPQDVPGYFQRVAIERGLLSNGADFNEVLVRALAATAGAGGIDVHEDHVSVAGVRLARRRAAETEARE